MTTVTLTEARNRHGEVFDRAAVEPVFVTKQGRPTHVIMSAREFEELDAVRRRENDRLWGEKATAALREDRPVGSERFTAALRGMARGKR